MERLAGRILGLTVHVFDLTFAPREIGLRETVLDAVHSAYALEDVAAAEHVSEAAPVPGLLGKRHPVVGQPRVDPVRERRNDLPQEGRTVERGRPVKEGDMGELRDAVIRREHVQLALRLAQLAAVDVHVADRRVVEAFALGILFFAARQIADAAVYQAAVLRAGAELREGLAPAAEHIDPEQGDLAAKRHHRLFAFTELVLRSFCGPIDTLAVMVRQHQLALFFSFNPRRAVRPLVATCDTSNLARLLGVVQAAS